MIEAPAMAEFNDLFAILHARSKDTPAKTWWDATAMHPAIFRALRMDKAEEGAIYAAAAFRLHKTEAGHRILLALPIPRLIVDPAEDWLDVETVLAWDPVNDTAEVLTDTGPQLVGDYDHDQPCHVYASPYTFMRAIAETRAQWFVQWRTIKGEWRSVAEQDTAPGLLAIGPIDKIRWTRTLPDQLVLHGLDAQAVNRAILRQAKIPRATAAPIQFEKAA